MEEMTLGLWVNDTRSSLTAGLQYVLLRVEEGRKTEKYDRGVELKLRERVKGEGRVILILFMNGWLRMCEYVYICVCVFINGTQYCNSADPGHLPFPLLC